MKKIPLLSTLLFFLLFSCEKSNYSGLEIDPNYPTIIRKPSSIQIEKLRSDFLKENTFLWTSLDEYGFCGWGDDLNNAPNPPFDTTLSKSEATAIAKNFILKNSKYTGVKDTTDFQFSKISKETGWYDGSIGWSFNTPLQKIDTIEVQTYLSIHIRSREVYFCIGNWYPDIYIPTNIKISQTRAKELLLNTVVTHYGWSGPWKVTITNEDLNNSNIKIYVVPIKTNDQIELHLAWYIDIPSPVFYIMYVDVMTGKIIRQDPTIIS